jgi:cysteinyl-tRNA synthetase
MHEEFLIFEREKMAKSKGNVLVLDELEARGIPPMAYRYFFLQAHYRAQQVWSDEAIEAAASGHRRLRAVAGEVREAAGAAPAEPTATLRRRFWDAVRDDLNAPRALAVVWEVARGELPPAAQRELLLDFDRWLGLGLATAEPADARGESDPRIDALVAEREAARRARDFAAADRIRAELAAEGIEIEDTRGGPRWRRLP